MNFKLIEDLCASQGIEYIINEPMKKHTSFKIGGPAEIFITPADISQLSYLLAQLSKNALPYFIIGNGSNILASDKGINGAVISLSRFNKITVDGCRITAGAGAPLSAVCLKAAEAGLSGLEFAYGIPGAVGGALYMNAGAYGGEMSQAVKSAEYLKPDGQCEKIPACDMLLGYRTSVFKGGDGVITSVELELKPGQREEINALMNSYIAARRTKQPLEFPSAGSTFKRPVGNFAGALIEKNNLKGVKVGGAMVSEKHAGFIINYNNATADDVRGLITLITETVYKSDGIRLEPEVIFVGE